MSEPMFKKAVKQQSKLRLALVGPSGSGKTWSALEVAKGLGGRTALIDTEHGSASLYSDRFDFDVCELAPPFSPEKYVKAIKAVEGYDTLVIDSLSHAWAGEGGLLEQVDARQRSGGNKFVAWGPATESQNRLINAILGCPAHVIVTFRAKMEYVMETNARGKQEPKKVGLAPVQREGVEYEFALVLDVGMDHMAKVGLSGKDRTGLFVGREPALLTPDDGKRLLTWLTTGEERRVAPDASFQNGQTLEDSMRQEAKPEASQVLHDLWAEYEKLVPKKQSDADWKSFIGWATGNEAGLIEEIPADLHKMAEDQLRKWIKEAEEAKRKGATS